MNRIKIEESIINLTNGGTGKIAVLMYVGSDDPVVALDAAVDQYVGTTSYNQFIDINMDNPCLRVITNVVNEIRQEDFNPAIHKLSL